LIREGLVATDELDTPLGQHTARKRKTVPAIVPRAFAGILGLFMLVFVLWAALMNDPYGGEPSALVLAGPSEPKAETAPGGSTGPTRYDGPPPAGAAVPKAPAGAQTITIIDGSSGKKQEVIVPGSETKPGAAVDTRLLENARHGPSPKIAPAGARPSDAYARKAPAASGNPDGPRVALIIGGLGVGANSTAGALSKLPGPVTLAFLPYGSDLERLVGRARGDGHEVLLQVPMEPFDYPDNDPGPQTLLSSLSAEQNVDRLQWLMSRFQGYVGITNLMGARFTASEQAISPILRETAKRGLIYLDDGSSARSLTSQIAGANKLPFARAEVIVDSVPTAAEIDKALVRLETLARERGIAVGFGSALPVTIERVARWAKSASGRGVTLVPVSVAAVKARSS
jgi:polysaccharide deacetylase 2 family uncharacterized protein YibQ